MSTLAPLPRQDDARTAALVSLLDGYKTEFELMCIQFLAGGSRLGVRDSAMALYQLREEITPTAARIVEALLIADGETVRALLELAEARGAAELQASETLLRRQRGRHTEHARQLHALLLGEAA